MRWVPLLLLSPALIACDGAGTQAGSRNEAFRDHVARQFAADCQRTRAPDAEHARVLQRLCACSEQRIRSSDIAYGESNDAITAKVHGIQDVCVREVYGDSPADGNAAR
jgi:hypothetical protein